MDSIYRINVAWYLGPARRSRQKSNRTPGFGACLASFARQPRPILTLMATGCASPDLMEYSTEERSL
jgi:hypothetical protein